MTSGILAVVDRRYPNATAEQHGDVIDFCVGLLASFGRFDLVLRGSAVSCAVDRPPPPGQQPAKQLPGPQRRLRTLIRTGVQIWADRADLVASGYPDAPLLAGVVVDDTDSLAPRWREYERVWFL